MDDASPRPRTWIRWFPIVGLGLFSLLPLYVASVGPACWLRQKGWLSYSSVEIMYAPVTALKDRAPRIFNAIDAYAGWWNDLAEEPLTPDP